MAGRDDTWWAHFQLHERERLRARMAEAAPGLHRAGVDARERQAAFAQVATALLQALAAAWRRGWQPGDLAHRVRRSLTADHLQVLRAAIGVELAAYPPSTIDPRWRPQLDELGVRVAPSADGAWLTGGDPAGAVPEAVPDAWVERLAVAADLAFAVEGLLAVERLTAAPGEYRAGRAAPAAGDGAAAAVDARVLARVRALLAKAESTPFPAEADTFTAGAQALMARHRIDAALLAAHDAAEGRPRGAEEPTGVRVWVDAPYESAKVSLLCAVARANRCRTLWRKADGVCTVLGFEADLAAVDALFTSLLVQATRAMTREGPRVDAEGRSRTRAFRHSFLLAFAHRVGERLAEAAGAQEQQASRESGGERLLPVLAARDAAVERAVAQLFPLLRPGRARVSAGDGEGWARGRAAADTAALGSRGRLPA